MKPPYATIRQVELETNYYFVMAYLASFATDLPPQIEVEDSLLQKNTVGLECKHGMKLIIRALFYFKVKLVSTAPKEVLYQLSINKSLNPRFEVRTQHRAWVLGWVGEQETPAHDTSSSCEFSLVSYHKWFTYYILQFSYILSLPRHGLGPKPDYIVV